MGARWYDADLGRWISPDSIVPHPGKPQDLNRFSYVRNNPLKYVDPTGHFLQCNEQGQCSDDGYSTSNPWQTSNDATQRRAWLLAYAQKLAGWASQGWTTNLEALAQLSNFSASLIPTNATNRTSAYVNDMSYVLVGSEGAGVLVSSFFAAHKPPKFGDTGFHEDYQDGQNQLYHFWAYVATLANANHGGGWALAQVGNDFHEFFDPFEAFRTITNGGLSGTSWEDYHLAYAGMAMGRYLADGTLPIERAGDYMRLALSTEYPGTSDNWARSLGTGWWPSKVWEGAVTTVYQSAVIDWYYYGPK